MPMRVEPTADAAKLEAAFARGDFAAVRANAHGIRSDSASSEEDRATADRYLQRIAAPPAARFALILTAALVLLLSGYFALVHAPH